MADVDSSSFAISLRPSAHEDAKSELLHDLIYRIHTERKGIRNVTEEQLEKEIEGEENGAAPDDDEDSGEDTKEEEEKGTQKFIGKKRVEMTKNLQYVFWHDSKLANILTSVQCSHSRIRNPFRYAVSPKLQIHGLCSENHVAGIEANHSAFCVLI
jgi:hypothetical protein